MSMARSLPLTILASSLLGLIGCFNASGDPVADAVGTETETETDTTTESTTETETETTETETTETDTGTCTAVGCECDGSEGSCDPALICLDGVCTEPVCGN